MRREIIYAQLNNSYQLGLSDPIRSPSTRLSETKMRKYYQAALLVTAVISVVSLLFYRHEYNKLRYVLEVFNYFGSANGEGSAANCSFVYENSGVEHKKFQLNLSRPLASWQRINEDLFVYSSFATDSQKVHTVSYGKLKNLEFECRLYFRNNLQSFPGVFSYNKITNSSDTPLHFAYRGYILTCEYSENEVPVGVVYNEKGKVSTNGPISPIQVQPSKLNYNGSALCVAPPVTLPQSPADMISFLNFHDLVGMNHFVIYDYGIPVGFHEALRTMVDSTSPYWTITYEVVPWNFPYPDIAHQAVRAVIEADCLYRTYNKVMYAAAVSWEEYIVLKFHHVVSDLLNEFSKSRAQAHRFLVKTQTFCTQQPDDKRATNSTPVVLRKTFTSPDEVDPNHIFLYKPHEAMRLGKILTHRASSELMMVNRYLRCTEYNPAYNKYDGAILRFAADIKNSPILKRYVDGKLLN